jgi:hypothetical protein
MLLRLTGLQGDPVLISGEDLIVHRSPAGSSFVNCTQVQTGAGQVFVREEVEMIAAMIEVALGIVTEPKR